jgi:penicillin-binding protein activator
LLLFYKVSIQVSAGNFNQIFKLMKNIILALSSLTLILSLGCKTTGVEVVRSGHAGGIISGWNVTAQDQLDAANNLVGRLLQAGALNRNDGKRHVIGVSRILNKTNQNVHSNILTDNIMQALNESGKCYATASFNLNELSNDPLVMKMRKLRASGEVRQGSVAKTNRLEAPQFSLQGSITQDSVRKGRNVEITYVVNLSVNDLITGVQRWSGQYFISKQGKGGARTW